ncbi:MAG: RlmE family RNA methyltransferase [Thaumarchaeota archaeon]|nr:MAG: RlmE family RNA methyltransferase [Nitrososphaerota archaeon]
MRLQDARRDLYRRLAKEEGFKSRAAYKLIEANERYGIIGRGNRVVDFGAAPGGWLQVCSRIVGDSGLVVGVDLREISLKGKNLKTLRLDVYDESLGGEVSKVLGGRAADVILSDLAPSVSGIWELDHFRQVEMTERVLSLGETLLKKGGNGFFKVFEGERSGEVRRELTGRFKEVRTMKPRASRRESSELYYVGLAWSGASSTSASLDTAETASATAP